MRSITSFHSKSATPLRFRYCVSLLSAGLVLAVSGCGGGSEEESAAYVVNGDSIPQSLLVTQSLCTVVDQNGQPIGSGPCPLPPVEPPRQVVQTITEDLRKSGYVVLDSRCQLLGFGQVPITAGQSGWGRNGWGVKVALKLPTADATRLLATTGYAWKAASASEFQSIPGACDALPDAIQ